MAPIEHGSPEYRASLELRHRLLREPLGLELTEEDTAGEESQHLFGLFHQSEQDPQARLVGAAIGKPGKADGEVRIRQVVVEESLRGYGLGALLMQEIECGLTKLGYCRFVLYARDEAAGFYDRCGYRATGGTEMLIGLEHLRMEKKV